MITVKKRPLPERLRQTAEWMDRRADIVGDRKAYHLAIEYQEVAAILREAATQLDEDRTISRGEP